MRVAVAFVVGVLCAFLVIAPGAIGAPRRITVVGGLGSRTFETATAAGKATGKLEILVRNDSTHYARPTARLLSPYPSSEAIGSAAVLAPGHIERVKVTLTGRSAPELIGRLALGLSGASPVRQQAVPVAPAEAEPQTTPKLPAIEPEEVTLHLTLLCPLGGLPLGHLWCGSARTPTVYLSAAAYRALKGGETRVASSSSGGMARITLSRSGAGGGSDPRDGLIPVRVYVRDDGHGEYTTAFILDESAKQGGQLKVKVEVQVWWFYPLFVLLGGAFLGYVVRWFGGTYRDRDVLKARLEEARSRYELGLDGHSLGMYPLRRWFRGFADSVPTIPRRKAGPSGDLSGFAKAWQQTQEARSSADIEAADKTVKEMESDVTNWLEINAALQQLDVSFQRLVPDKTVREDAIPAYQDTLALITSQSTTRPTDTTSVENILSAIEGQAEIVAAYEPARVAWRAVSHDTDELDDYDPRKLYGARCDPLQRTDSDVRSLVRRLNEATTKLQAHAEDAPTAMRVAPIAGPAIARSIGEEQPSTVEPEKIGSGAEKGRDPLHLRHEITARDWLVFGFTLLASAVVYLLTLYVGKNFGSASQYVQAFAVGFIGQTLAGVATFPLSRSVFNVGEKLASS